MQGSREGSQPQPTDESVSRENLSEHDYFVPQKSKVETEERLPKRKNFFERQRLNPQRTTKRRQIEEKSPWAKIAIEHVHPELTGKADACLQVMINEYTGRDFSMEQFRPREFVQNVTMGTKVKVFAQLCDNGYLTEVGNSPDGSVLYRLTRKHLVNPEE